MSQPEPSPPPPVTFREAPDKCCKCSLEAKTLIGLAVVAVRGTSGRFLRVQEAPHISGADEYRHENQPHWKKENLSGKGREHLVYLQPRNSRFESFIVPHGEGLRNKVNLQPRNKVSVALKG